MLGSKYHTVLIVDDSPQELQALYDSLKDRYKVVAAKGGKRALQLLEDGLRPDIILMEIGMEGFTGYETCLTLKQSETLHDIAVMFVSSKDSTEEILRGLDVGAADYLIKPFSDEILHSKISIILESYTAKKGYGQIKQLAMMAMSDTGDMGKIVSFLRKSYTVLDEAELADNLQEVLEEFGLSSCCYIKFGDIENARCSLCEMSEDEVDLLKKMGSSKEPIIDMGAKLIVAKGCVSVLVKGMPTAEAERGRIKDNLMILLEGANEKIMALSHRKDSEMEKYDKSMSKLECICGSLTMLQEHLLTYNKKSMSLMDTLNAQIQKEFESLMLTEKQEERLLAIISSVLGEAIHHHEQGETILSEISDITTSMQTIIH